MGMEVYGFHGYINNSLELFCKQFSFYKSAGMSAEAPSLANIHPGLINLN